MFGLLNRRPKRTAKWLRAKVDCVLREYLSLPTQELEARLERDFAGSAQWDRYVMSFRFPEQPDFLFSIDRGVEAYGRALFVHGQNRYAGFLLMISPHLRWDCSVSGASFRPATSSAQRLVDVFEKDFGILGSH